MTDEKKKAPAPGEWWWVMFGGKQVVARADTCGPEEDPFWWMSGVGPSYADVAVTPIEQVRPPCGVEDDCRAEVVRLNGVVSQCNARIAELSASVVMEKYREVCIELEGVKSNFDRLIGERLADALIENNALKDVIEKAKEALRG